MPVTEIIKRRLMGMYSGKCGFPGCNERLVDYDSNSIIGEVAHIKGESEKSARYDSTQDDNQRNSIDNLIFMCRKHHKIIDDNEDEFDTDILHRWKYLAEINFNQQELIPDSIVSVSKEIKSFDGIKIISYKYIFSGGQERTIDELQAKKIEILKNASIELIRAVSSNEHGKIFLQLLLQIPDARISDLIKLTIVKKRNGPTR